MTTLRLPSQIHIQTSHRNIPKMLGVEQSRGDIVSGKAPPSQDGPAEHGQRSGDVLQTFPLKRLRDSQTIYWRLRSLFMLVMTLSW